MNNQKINFHELVKGLKIDFGDTVSSYQYKRVFDRFSFRGSINDLFIQKLEAKIIPWFADWCCPWPIDYIDKEPFRGLNVFLLRSSQLGFCPYWLPWSYLAHNQIKVRKGEKGTQAIYKKDGISQLEKFYRLDQLEDIKIPEIKLPVKPPAEEGMKKVLDYFQEYLKYDTFNPDMADFHDQDYYYYMMLQYYCYSWYCHTYNETISFHPERHDRLALIYQLGASFLAAFCRISTFYYYTLNGYDRNLWIML